MDIGQLARAVTPDQRVPREVAVLARSNDFMMVRYSSKHSLLVERNRLDASMRRVYDSVQEGDRVIVQPTHDVGRQRYGLLLKKL